MEDVTSTSLPRTAGAPLVNRPSPVAVGTIVWLGSEVMFFAGLFAMYFTLRSTSPELWASETVKLARAVRAGQHADPGVVVGDLPVRRVRRRATSDTRHRLEAHPVGHGRVDVPHLRASVRCSSSGRSSSTRSW